MRVLVAGASGALGRHLVPELVRSGHEVFGTLRSPPESSPEWAAGARLLAMDGLDRESVRAAVRAAGPEVIIHQMTKLLGVPSTRRFDTGFATSNRLRTEGLDNLIAAGREVGVRRYIVQSFCGWPYRREGSPVKSETDPLDNHVAPQAQMTLQAIEYQERRVTGEAGMEGIALRYGGFYAEGTGVFDPMFLRQLRKRMIPVIGAGGGMWSFIHLADAARATAAFVTRGRPGIYNVVDDDPAMVREWLPALAAMVGARRPANIPKWLGRIAAGEHTVNIMTNVRAGSNAKLKAELGWAPEYSSWRDGFAAVAATNR